MTLKQKYNYVKRKLRICSYGEQHALKMLLNYYYSLLLIEDG